MGERAVCPPRLEDGKPTGMACRIGALYGTKDTHTCADSPDTQYAKERRRERLSITDLHAYGGEMDRYRLSIDIERTKHEKLKDNIPHGMLAVIFRQIVDDMCDTFDKYGPRALVAYMSGVISFEPLVKRFIEEYEANRIEDPIQRTKC